MLTVFIKTESHFKVDRQRVRETIQNSLKEKGVKGQVEVSLSIVGDRQMRLLNHKYRKLDETTNVLSFPLGGETNHIAFVDAPDGVLRLGDIVISYPQARDEASEENKMMDEKIDELLKHGMEHLLGIHHE